MRIKKIEKYINDLFADIVRDIEGAEIQNKVTNIGRRLEGLETRVVELGATINSMWTPSVYPQKGKAEWHLTQQVPKKEDEPV
jgi:hypothetical protein